MVYSGYERQLEHVQCTQTHMRAIRGHGLPEMPSDSIKHLIVCPIGGKLRSGFEAVSFLLPIERNYPGSVTMRLADVRLLLDPRI